eukprot:5486832-Pleurochrysis_carterae.AAC.2
MIRLAELEDVACVPSRGASQILDRPSSRRGDVFEVVSSQSGDGSCDESILAKDEESASGLVALQFAH